MKEITDIKLKEAIEEELRIIGHHFIKNGWDLNLSNLVDNVIYERFGFHISDILLQEVEKFKGNYGLKMKRDSGIVICNLDNEMAYYDDTKNEIHLIANRHLVFGDNLVCLGDV
jgi:hypothetical protein